MKTRDWQGPIVLRFFGASEITRAGRPVLRGLPRKGRAMLAMLAAGPGASFSRQFLADAFWPDLSKNAARSNLRQVVLVLRRALGERLTADREAIRLVLAPQDYCDVVEFDVPLPRCPPDLSPQRDCTPCLAAMEARLSLYRGGLLESFVVTDCPEFADWLQVRREALLRQAQLLAERLADCCESMGALDHALAFARRLVELEPWNEAAQRRAMRLAARGGHAGTALGYYHALVRLLREELGVPPEPETRELARRIQAGEFEPHRVAAAAPPPMERRQVTVLACRLPVDSDIEPEDALTILQERRRQCAAVIGQHGGHVTRVQDGALLAFFGYPEAQENAARRAVQAALALAAESWPDRAPGLGLHSGLVIAGTDPATPDAVGHTAGRAALLARHAKDGDILVSAATHRLVAGFFMTTAVGAVDPADCDTLEGFRVLGPSGAEDRLEAAAELNPLVGRARELARLGAAWQAARSGGHRALLVQGEPGIGKSRLVHSLRQIASENPCTVLTLRCSAETSGTPFHPVLDLLARRFDLRAEESPQRRFQRLARRLERDEPEQAPDLMPLFAEMLSLPVTLPYRPLQLAAADRRAQFMTALLERLTRMAALRPLLLVVEDLHWGDPTTLELLVRLAELQPPHVMNLCTARPEFDPPWPEAAVALLPLGPLAAADVHRLISVASRAALPAPLREAIASRADGVPLFAEELVRIASGTQSGALPAIPASLRDLFAARLDGLGEARGLVQLAATIGRTFPLELLEILYPGGREALLPLLNHLREVGLVVGSVHDGFRFRHVLMRDAAYDVQPRGSRQALHRRIAETMESRFPEMANRQPEILAGHWGAGDAPERAVDAWIRAGRRAHRHGAFREALHHFRAGLEQHARLAPSLETDRRELALQIGLGATAYAAAGYAAPEGWCAYNRAAELSEQMGGDEEAFQALWGVWASTSSQADLTRSLDVARRLVRMAERSGDPVQLQQGHFAVGNIQFWRGAFRESRHHLETAIAPYEPRHHEELVSGYGENAYVTAAAFLSWTHCFLGNPESARAAARRSVAEARRVAHPFTLGYSLTFVTVLHRMLREPRLAFDRAEETIALAKAHSMPLWETGARLKRGWSRVMLGDAEGVGEMRAAVEKVRGLMSGISLIFLETLADGLLAAGRTGEARAVLQEAFDVVERIDDHHVEAELHRLEGTCLLREGDASAAEAAFGRALAIAADQEALLLELRAATALAALWHDRDEIERARALLAPIYGRFEEGRDMPDMAAAAVLLERP